MAHSHSDPLDHAEVRQTSASAALFGTLLALGFMGFALLLTLGHVAAPLERMIAVASLAAFALVAQAGFLFRLGVNQTQIWKTVALVLILPLFVLSIGLTDFMFYTLYARTMLHAVATGGGM